MTYGNNVLFSSLLHLALSLFFSHRAYQKQDNDFPSFLCSRHVPLVIIYQLCQHKSSFCVEGTNPWELPEEIRGDCNITRLLCDNNDGSVVAGGLKVMNNSHYFPIWWMTAVLKVNLTSEVVTEWWTCVIESRPHHLLFDVILVCGSVLSVSNGKIHNYFCWR